MRSIQAFLALVAIVSAQEESLGATSTRRVTSDDNAQPSATETVSGPIETGKACAQIAEFVDESQLEYPTVEAELAYACLKSVPIDEDAASQTVTSLKQLLQFQSTLTYLKNPPKGYANEGVDLLAGLNDIGSKVNSSSYDNEYDFENDIAALLIKAHDGHLSFGGMAYGGTFKWRRDRQIALISASSDGKETPKVWAIQDFNQTGKADFKPSAISQIDGKDISQFLEEESLLNAYHDPDTRYNALFYMQPSENFGYFGNPRFYPGPSVNISFENNTWHEYQNTASVLDRNAWSSIEDGESFYNTLVVPQETSLKKRSLQSLPNHLQNPRDGDLDGAILPAGYPDPLVEHPSEDVPLAGFFIDSPNGKVGVLTVPTFNTETDSEAKEFQAVVEDYINQAKNEKVSKHIIDVRNNGGGKILLGYDLFLQFFPSQKPQLQSRYRGHEASDTLGSSLSSFTRLTLDNGDLYTSPFNYRSYMDADAQNFTSWTDMYPPKKFNDDSFTDLFRYDLNNPLTTVSSLYSLGVTMTGYGTRANFTEDPFKAEDLIILSDGLCASTCSLFTELMVQQSGVKTLAVGGRPSTGPMQPVGGTKGSLVLQAYYLTTVSSYVLDNFASSSDKADEWTAFLPREAGIAASDASVNFQDNIRKGLEKDGVPTQFLNDTASCRIWYEADMYLNVTTLWSKAAAVAFGKDGGLDEDACIQGSVSSKGQGDGNSGGSGSGTDNGNASPSGSKAAAPGAVRPGHGGWTAILMCAAVVVGSMAFGASLV